MAAIRHKATTVHRVKMAVLAVMALTALTTLKYQGPAVTGEPALAAISAAAEEEVVLHLPMVPMAPKEPVCMAVWGVSAVTPEIPARVVAMATLVAVALQALVDLVETE
jgi:hypothetical protein